MASQTSSNGPPPPPPPSPQYVLGIIGPIFRDTILVSAYRPPLLPTPRTVEEDPTILAVARAYAHRTSAPPMWDPALPVIGFATPNPLPHQLRGGALGAMQRKLAREERKRRRNKEMMDRQREEREWQTLEEEGGASCHPPRCPRDHSPRSQLPAWSL